MAGKLAKLAAGILMTHYTRSKVDLSLLAEVTATAGGRTELVEAVAAANTGRHAYELWESAELLRPAGELLCRRVAEVLTRFSDGRLTTDVAMVDFAGDRVVASSGRWAA
jgi:cobalt-precorrin-5B (C1)-methyltransferase